jgi:Zn2+/Cd2+-exporting ATPase
VRPGERFPLDGVVESGESTVDESPITGESVPLQRSSGDQVYAGTRNQLGALVVRTTGAASESTIARIVELVEQAQASRAPSERFVERFARVYTPLVFGAALLVAVVPWLLGADGSTWIYRALALLIVACPCSLVISIPVAVVSAIGAAAHGGVLLKGGQALEDLAAIDVVAFDKTGTLTSGTPRLVSIETLERQDERDALRLAASLERHSEHPLAAAIVHAARERGLELDEPERIVALPGRGVDAQLDGRVVWAGAPRLARERLGSALPAVVALLEEQGQTVIVLGEERRPLAVLGLRDEPRAEAAEAVVSLGRLGVASLVLTGDNEAVARSVAGAIGIDEQHASLLPADKLRLVEQLQERRRVAMVGDGINDAPALAAAQVGVAMGAAGSAVALDTADVALLGDDLRRLPATIAIARSALAVMRQNVAASLVVKGVFVALIPFGLVTLWMAVAADMGMSLLVTANALRLLRRASEPSGRLALDQAETQAHVPQRAVGARHLG